MPDVTITVSEDGPYVVEGDVRITDYDGRELDLPTTSSSAAAGSRGTIRSATAPTPRSTSTEPWRTDRSALRPHGKGAVFALPARDMGVCAAKRGVVSRHVLVRFVAEAGIDP
jgi:hypothetical protein